MPDLETGLKYFDGMPSH